MKALLTLCLLALALAGRAQNQIITPVGKPLVIGNQGGVKFSHFNAHSPTQASNGKVLSVDDSGVIMLVPESAGTPSQWTSNGQNIYFNTGNVGLGTNTPLQRLDVNGSINMPLGSGIRFGNSTAFQIDTQSNLRLGLNAGGQGTSSGSNNILIGSQAQVMSTGSSNLFFGLGSGHNTTSGGNNVMIGTSTGYGNSTGSRNTFAGEGAGYVNTTGSDNTFIGRYSGQSNTTGGWNLYVGRASGQYVTSGNGNTFIGDFATSNLTNTSYSSALGESARVDCDYCLVLGRTNPQVKVGIGTSTPQTTFHIVAGGTTATGVRLENLPNTNGTGAYLLYVDASGNVLRKSVAGAREASRESANANWTLTTNDHVLNANSGGVIIGTGLSVTPAGYKLYVSDGILTERVKVAVKSTDEWRDQVLAAGYKLRSIEEVQSFIHQKGHLPGVPSAQEMVQNGNDLHQTDALLLEKIEELTLYIIGLKTENTDLRREVSLKQKGEAELTEYRSAIRSLLERVEVLEKK